MVMLAGIFRRCRRYYFKLSRGELYWVEFAKQIIQFVDQVLELDVRINDGDSKRITGDVCFYVSGLSSVDLLKSSDTCLIPSILCSV
jgi:hypothetical protein